MVVRTQTWKSFVPQRLVGRLEEAMRDGMTARFAAPAAVLFADISNFSAFVENLIVQHGEDGAEAVTRTIDERFGPWIGLTEHHGGEVVKFAGDAILAVFWGSEGELRNMVERAVACAIDIQNLTLPAAAEGRELTQSVRIGAGRLRAARFGGSDGRWEASVFGAPVNQIKALAAETKAGHTSLSAEAWRALGRNLPGVELASGAVVLEGRARLDDPSVSAPRAPAHAVDSAVLASYVPRVVHAVFEVGLDAYLAEHRLLGVNFIHLRGLEADTDQGIELMQAAVTLMLDVLGRHGGHLDKLSVDDKGISALAAYGLPVPGFEAEPRAYVDAALEIHRSLTEIGVESSIGVSSGRVVAGPVGSEQRREYTIVGKVVNLAARLMLEVKSGVVCDGATRTAMGSIAHFESLGERRLRGIEAPMELFHVRPRAGVESHTPTLRAARKVYGRTAELARIALALDGSPDEAARLLVSGPAGVGKTTLMAAASSFAARRGLKVTLVVGRMARRTSAFSSWRPAVRVLLELPAEPEPEMVERACRRKLGEASELLQLVPLLSPVIGLELPDNERTAPLRGAQRMELTLNVLAELLMSGREAADQLVLLDDLQWFDPASLELAISIARRTRGPHLLGAMRPEHGVHPDLMAELLTRCELLELGGLHRKAVHELLSAVLKGPSVPTELSRWFHTRTGGNPLFCWELLHALLAQRVVEVGGALDQYRNLDLEHLDVPETIESVIRARIDRLAPLAQLVVKCGSAVGEQFDRQLLAAVFPLKEEPARIEDATRVTVEAGLLSPAVSGAREVLRFPQTLIAEVAYRSMIGEQRRGLHESIASHLESDPVKTDSAVVAHHWDRASRPVRALHHLDRAARTADAAGLSRNVIAWLDRAFELVPLAVAAGGGAPPALTLARWHHMRADAHSELSHYRDAETDVAACLRILGIAVPRSQIGWGGLLLKQILRQLAHRQLPGLFLRAKAPNPGLEMASKASAILMTTSYYTAESPVALPTAGFWSVNLAQRALAPPPRSSMALVGVVLGSLGMGRLSERYFEEGRAQASAFGDLNALAGSCLIEGVHHALAGEADRSQDSMRQALAAAEALGSSYMEFYCLDSYAFSQYMLGRLPRALDLYQRAASVASRGGLRNQELATMARIAAVAEALGRSELSRRAATQAETLDPEEFNRVEAFVKRGLAAWLALRSGALDAALEGAAASLDGLSARSSIDPGFFDTLNQIAEIELSALRNAGGPPTREQRRRIDRLLKLVAAHARAFKLFRPAHSRIRGSFADVGGRGAQARRGWRKALAEAERLGLFLEMARTRMEMARSRSVPAEQRRAALQEARASWTELGFAGLLSDCDSIDPG
jgi:class 3 adenylate cyclase/tetratricopeptide (TPR) repeat protein